MSGNKVDFDKAKAEVSGEVAARKSEQSKIAFPVYDLEGAIAITRHVYARMGLGSCPLDELAAEAGVTISGNFRNRTSAAKMFGFVEKDGQSKLKLTDLGARVVSAEAEAEARATAFLNIPLYAQIYEKYRGKLLPPSKALEREIIGFGVITTMAGTARQIMQRSARQAGYFNSGDDRLVRPRVNSNPSDTIEQAVADAPPSTRENNVHGYGGNGGGGDGGAGQYHPFIQGLLQTLPAPGTLWTIEGRAAWLMAAAQNFTLIYKGEGRIEVKVEAASKSQTAS